MDVHAERLGLGQVTKSPGRLRPDPVIHWARIAASITLTVLLSGCATAAAPVQSTDSGPTSTFVAGTRPIAAAADAAMLLTLAPVPPGANREASSPVQAISGAPQTPGSPDLVDQTAWWTAPGTMASITTWVQSQVPAGATVMGTGSSSTRGVNDSEYVVFAFLAQPPVLTWRTLAVTVTPNGPSQVAVRADAQVIWDPARLPASQIDPKAVSSITVTRLPSFPEVTGTTTAVGPPATVTDPSRIRSFVTVLNGLPIDNSGVHSCPAWSGLSFTVDLKGSDKSTVATLSGDQAQCEGLALAVGSAPHVSVDDPGDVLIKQIASILGIQLPKG